MSKLIVFLGIFFFFKFYIDIFNIDKKVIICWMYWVDVFKDVYGYSNG